MHESTLLRSQRYPASSSVECSSEAIQSQTFQSQLYPHVMMLFSLIVLGIGVVGYSVALPMEPHRQAQEVDSPGQDLQHIPLHYRASGSRDSSQSLPSKEWSHQPERHTDGSTSPEYLTKPPTELGLDGLQKATTTSSSAPKKSKRKYEVAKDLG
jgi:hypothetical protein